ncbi:hypothetical protein F2Q68_00012878 [Brassica cretica]|uniref:Uncharacterized protein n=1 Tax=Brassica cretica TaxID=69181 RepID=A0A8S9HFI5_BRACR|nr:hypothetical protein F2Q68_00012880 [Brassica cretica]KAF2559229.1 hypothetical protein F2Q68_00012878 [Brassica cretica]
MDSDAIIKPSVCNNQTEYRTEIGNRFGYELTDKRDGSNVLEVSGRGGGSGASKLVGMSRGENWSAKLDWSGCGGSHVGYGR